MDGWQMLKTCRRKEVCQAIHGANKGSDWTRPEPGLLSVRFCNQWPCQMNVNTDKNGNPSTSINWKLQVGIM